MRIGICTTNENQWKAIKENGYDYIEMQFQRIAKITDEEFENMKKLHSECGLDVETAMSFFTSDFKIYAYDPETGDGTDEFENNLEHVRQYSELGLSRAAQLGLKIVVVGSGTNRRIPDDMNHDVAIEQFLRVLAVIGDVAAKYGVQVAIEPLNKNETNLVTTLAEGLEICRKLKHPNVYVLNDFYHSHIENESYDALRDAGELLIHTHISDYDRTCPTLEKDGACLIPAVQELVNTGYDARMSYECAYKPDFNTAIANSRTLADELRKLKVNK